jgi:hypothetical protein
MRLPQGWFYDSTMISLQQHIDSKFNDTSHFIHLKRHLYGCKQATRNWYKCLNQGILAEGFYQSKTDHAFTFVMTASSFSTPTIL